MNWEKWNRVWDDRDLTPNEKLVLCRLLDHENGDGIAFPSQRHISQKTNLGLRTVNRAIKDLERTGKLAIRHRPGYASTYEVFPEEPDEGCAKEAYPPTPERRTPAPERRTPHAREAQPIETPKEPPIKTPKEKLPAATPHPPVNFQEWIKILRESKNRVAVLGKAFETLYPQLGPPDYKRIGATAKRISASRLMEYLWEFSMRNVNATDCGALMNYLQGVVKNRGKNQTVNPADHPTLTPEEEQRQKDEFQRLLRERDAKKDDR